MNSAREITPRIHRAALGVLCLSAIALPGMGFASQQDSKVDLARETLSEWVATRRVLSKERQDWILGKEMLEDRIELIQEEIRRVRGRLGEMQSNIADADQHRNELIEENTRLHQASAGLMKTVRELETRCRLLLERIPDPIRERVKPLSQRIPAESEQSQLSLSDRFMNVVGILNTVDKFNREITVTSEVHTLPGGRPSEVTAMYLGIGQGYFASQGGQAAALGAALGDSWEWFPADAAAPAILQAIRILQNEEPATFVRLPVRID